MNEATIGRTCTAVASLGYLPGPVVPNPHNVSRNDPCPCRSGKKFKKCCATARKVVVTHIGAQANEDR